MSKEKEPRTKTMECPNGHHFPAQLWYWVQYVEEGGERGPARACLMYTHRARVPVAYIRKGPGHPQS
jgi:hypothetical protein